MKTDNTPPPLELSHLTPQEEALLADLVADGQSIQHLFGPEPRAWHNDSPHHAEPAPYARLSGGHSL